MEISSERLAYWFLRLNGFMTIYNFVVHPEEDDLHGNYSQQTDVDVIGVRFPFRCENRRRPMVDHGSFEAVTVTQLVLAETKSGRCRLNATWQDPSYENMQKVLSSVGVLAPVLVEDAARALYQEGQWSDDILLVRWVLFGDSHNREIGRRYPKVPQFTWREEVLPFVRARFLDYSMEKRMHSQWDEDAKGLFRAAINSTSLDEFVKNVDVVSPQG